MKAAAKGKDLFMTNCSVCHFHDRQDTKVGPGLAGLFKQDRLPKSGKPATENVVRNQIINGSGSMPSFKHLKQEEITAIIDYLKSL